MSRPVRCFLISLFLNTGAGNEFLHLFPGGFAPADPPTGSLAGAPRSPRRSPGSFARARSLTPWEFARDFQTPAERGTWVARQIEDRETASDMRLAIRMRLFDRHQRPRERALTLLALRGGSGRPVPGDRTLVRFTYPNDISGTGFLVWERPSAEDERFLYLPALGRVRRIAGSETQESFVGSDFTYEDIGGREFDDYTYRLLGEGRIWTSPDGAAHPVYELESRSRDRHARFPRVVSLVRKDNFVVVHAEIFDARNEVRKTFEVRRLERVGGYWTSLEMRMADALQRTRTELVVEKVEYDIGLTPDAFSRRELERGRSH